MLFVSDVLFDVNDWKDYDNRIHKNANCRYRDNRTYLDIIYELIKADMLESDCAKEMESDSIPCSLKDEVSKKTNADSIRTMSDEELAMNMMCPNESGLGEIECDKSDNCNCYKCLLKWLQSEVK